MEGEISPSILIRNTMINPIRLCKDLSKCAQQINRLSKVRYEGGNKYSIKFGGPTAPKVITLLEIGEFFHDYVQAKNLKGYWIWGNRKSASLAWGRVEIWSTAYEKNQRKLTFIIEEK